MHTRQATPCLLAALLGGFLGWAPRVQAGVSASEEKDLGKKFALEARAKLPLIDDVEVNRYVDRIGQKIVAALGSQPFQYHFYVVRDPRINAFAVPAGYIYVHGGLLTHASNDDEVAGVLGHEIAHVNAHHLARQQEATQLLNYATLLGVLLSVVQPAVGAGAVAINAATQLKYRREFEQEADYWARDTCAKPATIRAACWISSRRCGTSNVPPRPRRRRICCRIRSPRRG